MKEIKFKVWNKLDKEMLDEVAVYYYFKQRTSLNELFKDEDYVFLQFIGRKDKNGKEIYEGDIVKHNNGIQVVEWCDYNYSFQMNLNNAVLDQEITLESKDVEVIGNIYENPELIIL